LIVVNKVVYQVSNVVTHLIYFLVLSLLLKQTGRH